MYKYIFTIIILSLMLWGCANQDNNDNAIQEYITKEISTPTENPSIHNITTEIIPIQKEEVHTQAKESPKQNTIKAYNAQNEEIELSPVSEEELKKLFPEMY